jgi:hypothetical protein
LGEKRERGMAEVGREPQPSPTRPAGREATSTNPLGAPVELSGQNQQRPLCFVIYKKNSELHFVIWCQFTSQKDFCFLTEQILSHSLTPFKKGTSRGELDSLCPSLSAKLGKALRPGPPGLQALPLRRKKSVATQLLLNEDFIITEFSLGACQNPRLFPFYR